jgi:NMD protein affecting ribosome stability and mRNA decay
MTWTCPRCGGEKPGEDKSVCDGCIAEEVAIIFDEDEDYDEDDGEILWGGE